MTVYYNEFDPYPAQWLRNLIEAGHLPKGDVDERSIADVQPSDLAGYRQCHFFAGIGGWPLALRLAGAEDIDGLWTGSCPCQPLSVAGQQKGHADERHLWPAFYSLIAERKPSIVFGEQVAGKLGYEWLAGVRHDLEACEYAVGAADLPACSVGAPHRRNRIWFVAQSELAGSGDNARSFSGQGRQPMDAGAAGLRQGHGPGVPSGAEARDRSVMAHADQSGQGEGRQQRSGQFGGAGGDPCAGGVDNTIEPGPQGQSGHEFQTTEGRQEPDRPAAAGSDGALSDTKCTGLQGSAGGGGNGARVVRGEYAEDGGSDVADAHVTGSQARSTDKMGNGDGPRCDEGQSEGQGFWHDAIWITGADGKARRVKPDLRLMDHGIPARVGKLRALGNAIVPQLAAEFIRAAL